MICLCRNLNWWWIDDSSEYMYCIRFSCPVHPSHYNKYLKYISKASFDICNESMKAACINLKMLYGVPEIDVIDVPVIIDGTWQNRYGHNSLLGVSFVISMDTGCMLDYSVK